MNSRSKRGYFLGAVVLSLVCVMAIVAAAALAALSTSRSAPPPDPDSLRVSIRTPSSGSQVRVGEGTTVLLHATSPPVRYELWVDGARESVFLPEPGESSLPSSLQVPWRPLAAGPVVLMARAVGADGQTGRSRPVIVEAVSEPRSDRVQLDLVLQPGDTLESLSSRFDTPQGPLLDLNPGWSGEVEEGGEIRVPIPDSQLPPGFAGDDGAARGEADSPADQPAPEPAAGLPSRLGSPTSTAAEACRVTLVWGASQGADGYRISRFGGGQMDFVSVGEVGADDPAFEDTVPLAGVYQYVIAAFNARGIVESDPASIEVPVEHCPESAPVPEDGLAWLDLEVLSFTTDGDFDRAYCYVSPLPGAGFSRIPAGEDEFLRRSGEMWDIARFAAGIGRLGFLQPADHAAQLQMECWGWQGGDLAPLGSLDLQHPRPEWDGRDLSASADRFEAIYRLVSHTNQLPQLSPVFAGSGPPPPEHLRRPETLGECLEGVARYSGENGGAAFAGALACLSVDLHSLAIWDWTERADPYYSRHDLLGFRLYVDRLGRDVQAIPQSEWELYAEADRSPQLYPLLDPPCGQRYSFWAVAYGAATTPYGDLGPVQEGPGGPPPVPGAVYPIVPVMESVPSAVLMASGPDCPIQEVLIEVTLDSIEIGHTVDTCFDIDMECDDVRLETYGRGTFVRIRPDGESEQVAEVTFWGDFSGECGMAHACLGLGSVGANRTVLLAGEPIGVCDAEGCTGMVEDNNQVRFWLGDGDEFAFEFTLWDQDDASGDDIWCGTTDDASGWGGAGKFPAATRVALSGARTAEEWADLHGATGRWDNDGLSRQDADCEMNFITSAVEVAQ